MTLFDIAEKHGANDKEGILFNEYIKKA